jgi:drug/metabolite transporter (DMT)-like permease
MAFGDTITVTDIIGLAIVFVGIVLTQIKPKKLNLSATNL